FMKMQSALAQRQNVLVVTMPDGAVFALTKYASMSVYLAGRELRDDLEAITSHMRAAEAEARESPGDLAGILKAERIYGRSWLTDYLAVTRLGFGAFRARLPAFLTRGGDRGSRAKGAHPR